MIFGVVITKNKEEVVSEIQLQDYKPFLEGKDEYRSFLVTTSLKQKAKSIELLAFKLYQVLINPFDSF